VSSDTRFAVGICATRGGVPRHGVGKASRKIAFREKITAKKT
jgi:coenzyme F420-reducing hydrogenase gamma subunit